MPRPFDFLSLIRLQSAHGLGARSLRRLLAWAQGESISLPDVFTLDAQTLALQAGLKPDVARAVLAAPLDDARATLARLETAQVEIVALGDEGYPARLASRLGENAPPVLYVQGERSLLGAPGVAFSGSRRASEGGIEAARDLAAQAAARGLTAVSGHAPGTDLAAHAGALGAGGSTTLVLPEGILKFRLSADLRPAYAASPDRFVIVSEFPPNAPWSTPNAMIRNHTILGLARALIVIEAGETGGALVAGQSALKLGLPCHVLDSPGLPAAAGGNRVLLDRGARPLRPDRSGAFRLPDLDAPDAETPPDKADGQLRLF